MPMKTLKNSSIGVIESMHQSPLTQFRLSSELSDTPARMGMRIVVSHQTILSFLSKRQPQNCLQKMYPSKSHHTKNSSKKGGSILARALAGWDAVRVWSPDSGQTTWSFVMFLVQHFFGNEEPHHLILLDEMFCVHNDCVSRVTYNRQSCG